VSAQRTEYIWADTRLCEACGDCVEACRRGVLTVKGPRFHRHVRVDHPEECRGCGKCVAACPHGSLGSSGRLVHVIRKPSGHLSHPAQESDPSH
jgi:NAD-dependent dihydropyrimidine dehydrogenase PreA subunit